jgi:hypothetical protein
MPGQFASGHKLLSVQRFERIRGGAGFFPAGVSIRRDSHVPGPRNRHERPTRAPVRVDLDQGSSLGHPACS